MRGSRSPSSPTFSYRRLAGALIAILSGFLIPTLVTACARKAVTSVVPLRAKNTKLCPLFPVRFLRFPAIHDTVVNGERSCAEGRGVYTLPSPAMTAARAESTRPSEGGHDLLSRLTKQTCQVDIWRSLNVRTRALKSPRSIERASAARCLDGPTSPPYRLPQAPAGILTCWVSISLAPEPPLKFPLPFYKPARFCARKEVSADLVIPPLSHMLRIDGLPPRPATVANFLRYESGKWKHIRNAFFLYFSLHFRDKRLVEILRKSEFLRRTSGGGASVYCCSLAFAGAGRNWIIVQAFNSSISERCPSSASPCTDSPLQYIPRTPAAELLFCYCSQSGWHHQKSITRHRREHVRLGCGKGSSLDRDEAQPVYSEIDEEGDLGPLSTASGWRAPVASPKAESEHSFCISRAASGKLTGATLAAQAHGLADEEKICASGFRDAAPPAEVDRTGSLYGPSKKNSHPFCDMGNTFSDDERAQVNALRRHKPPYPFRNHILFDEKVFEKMNALRQLIFRFESSEDADISSGSIEPKYLPLLCEGDLLERTLQLARENYEKQVALHASGDPQQQADIFAAAAEWRQQHEQKVVAKATAQSTQQLQYKSGTEVAYLSPSDASESVSFPPCSSMYSSSCMPLQQSDGSTDVTGSADALLGESEAFLRADAAGQNNDKPAGMLYRERKQESQKNCSKDSEGSSDSLYKNPGCSRNGNSHSDRRYDDMLRGNTAHSTPNLSSSSSSYFKSSSKYRKGDGNVSTGPRVPRRLQSPPAQLRRFEEVAAQLLQLANFYRRRLAKKKIGDPQQIDAAFFTMAEQRQLDAHLLNFVEELIREAHIKYTAYRSREALSETALKLLKRRIEAHLELEKHKRQDFVRILSLCFQTRTEKRRAVLKATLYTLEDLSRFQEWLEEGITYGELLTELHIKDVSRELPQRDLLEQSTTWNRTGVASSLLSKLEKTGRLSKEQLQIMRALVKDCKQASPLENRFLDRWGEENVFQSDVNLQYTWDRIVQDSIDVPPASA